jgi:hypothetical protein
VIERALDAVVEAASVTCTVKSKVPAADGVPVIAPVLTLRDSPVGKLPDAIDQVYAGVPPLAVRDWLYAAATVPADKVVVVIDNGSIN